MLFKSNTSSSIRNLFNTIFINKNIQTFVACKKIKKKENFLNKYEMNIVIFHFRKELIFITVFLLFTKHFNHIYLIDSFQKNSEGKIS